MQVITDPATGRTKGYGFVRFGSETERDRALADMNGHYIAGRPIRVSLATAKKPGVVGAPGGEHREALLGFWFGSGLRLLFAGVRLFLAWSGLVRLESWSGRVT